MGERILLISYHFPPSAAVGGQRMANFARALPAFGYEPTVLTIREDAIEQVDRARMKGLEAIDVETVRILPTLASGWTTANRLIRLALRRRSSSPERSPATMAAAVEPAPAESFVRRVRRYVLSFLLLPDAERGWLVPASLAAIRRMRARDVKWIITSCPPYSTHLVGLTVKLATGVKWVADFRDPWMTTGSKRLFPTSALSIRLESWLERRVIEAADVVVFNVERLRNAYRARYAHVPPHKFVFIPNGIAAPVTIDADRRADRYSRFTIAYTGSLYVGRSPEPVFEALARLIARQTIQANEVCLKLVGQCRTTDGTPTTALVRKYGLEAVVEVGDPVPVTEALDIVRRSHLALLLAPGLPYQVPAKFYDYLAVGTRVLAIAEQGGTADLVAETGCGRAFAPSDVDGIAAFIQDEIAAGPNVGNLSSALARFDVRRITGELVQHLEQSPVKPQPKMAF